MPSFNVIVVILSGFAVDDEYAKENAPLNMYSEFVTFTVFNVDGI